MQRAYPEIRKKGAELVIIGNGNRHFANGFKEALKLQSPLYVDTQRVAYAALGMKRSIASVLSLKAMKNAARALKAGNRQTSVQGDAWQLGGVLVVRPGGQVAYEYRSEQPGDHPPVEDVLAAL